MMNLPVEALHWMAFGKKLPRDVRALNRKQCRLVTGLRLTRNCPWTNTVKLKSKSKSHCDWRSVSQSASLGVEPHLELMTRYLLLFDRYGLVFLGRPLWREDWSDFCTCPCQRSLSQVRVPWDSRQYFTVSDLRLRFSSPPTTLSVTAFTSLISTLHRPQGKHRLCCFWRHCLPSRCLETGCITLLFHRCSARTT
jgi:hypothetical protein